MISAKDLVDELGGVRGITLGAVLVVCSYVAASRYVETVEERIGDAHKRIAELEKARQRFEAFEQARREFKREYQIRHTVDGLGVEDE